MDSPFQRYLGTNHVPSIEEMREIRNLLENSFNEISDIDREIDQLQQRLSLLQEKKAKAYDFVEQHRALISPSRRLNHDILEQIFLACLPADRNPCMSATEAPMLLTRICSLWRNIALCTPRLWAAIHIVLSDIYTMLKFPPENFYSLQEDRVRFKLAQREAATKEWLDRSRGYPLSISLYQRTMRSVLDGEVDHLAVEKEDQLHLSFIVSTLIPHIQRWYELDVHTDSRLFEGLIQNGVSAESMQTLKKLHITSQYDPNRYPGQQEKIKFLDVVGLLSQRIISATISVFRFSGPLPDLSSIPHYFSNKITELNLISTITTNGISQISFFFSVIRHCWSLETLKLSILNGERTRRARYLEPIVLPNLTTFLFTTMPIMESLDFVNSLRLHSLERLDFHILGPSRIYSESQVQESIIKLLQYCGESLQNFGFYFPVYLKSTSDMVELLRLTPNLRSLKVSSSISHSINIGWRLNPTSIGRDEYKNYCHLITDNLLYELSPSGKEYSDIICPKLEVLEFDRFMLTGISEKALKEFVKARMHTHLSDHRMVILRRLCIFVNQFKQTDGPKEDRVTLGENSAVYFRKRPKDLPPWEGLILNGEVAKRIESFEYEVFTYL